MPDRPKWVRVRESDEENGDTHRWRERIDAEQLEVEGYGMKAKFKGREIAVLVMYVVMMAAVVYIIHTDAIADAKAHTAIQNNQRELIEVIEVQNWLSTLDPRSRPRLKKPVAAQKYLMTED